MRDDGGSTRHDDLVRLYRRLNFEQVLAKGEDPDPPSDEEAKDDRGDDAEDDGDDGQGADPRGRGDGDRRFRVSVAVVPRREESKMLGGASQIVSTIRVTCNGK